MQYYTTHMELDVYDMFTTPCLRRPCVWYQTIRLSSGNSKVLSSPRPARGSFGRQRALACAVVVEQVEGVSLILYPPSLQPEPDSSPSSLYRPFDSMFQNNALVARAVGGLGGRWSDGGRVAGGRQLEIFIDAGRAGGEC